MLKGNKNIWFYSLLRAQNDELRGGNCCSAGQGASALRSTALKGLAKNKKGSSTKGRLIVGNLHHMLYLSMLQVEI